MDEQKNICCAKEKDTREKRENTYVAVYKTCKAKYIQPRAGVLLSFHICIFKITIKAYQNRNDGGCDSIGTKKSKEEGKKGGSGGRIPPFFNA
jgi:hypothetical protein